MQEAELIERVEHFFADALARTYQRDALIDLYRALRQIWGNLMQPSEQFNYLSKLDHTLKQIRSICLLWNQESSQLAEADQEIIRQIESQFAQLAEQAKSQ